MPLNIVYDSISPNTDQCYTVTAVVEVDCESEATETLFKLRHQDF